ncbi:MAG: VTT domain-containing protein [archaeon]|nr:VTT domain-containing protein [archaeon]
MAFDIGIFLQGLIQAYGLLGLFAASIIAHASLFLPVPIDIFVFLLGSTNFFNPFFIAIAAALGAMFGEMIAYIIGLGGYKLIGRVAEDSLDKIEMFRDKIKKSGMIFIATFAFIPFPFDLIGIAAGMIKYDWKKFMISVFVGKFFRYLVIAFAGLHGLEFLAKLLGV